MRSNLFVSNYTYFWTNKETKVNSVCKTLRDDHVYNTWAEQKKVREMTDKNLTHMRVVVIPTYLVTISTSLLILNMNWTTEFRTTITYIHKA